MSFWGGVAKGFEAGEAKREREEVRKVAADRNEIQDKRWQMQWDQSQETILYNKDRNTQADKLAAEALEYAKGRNTQADTLAAEALSIARNKEIINALKVSGTTGSTTGKRSKVATAKEIRNASIDLNLALGGVEGLSALPDDQKEFYTSTLADASATMQLVAFAKANKINLNDVHSYMEIGAVVASQGAEGMAKLKAQIADGTLNLTGENAAENFIKTFKTIADYVPGYTQLTQTSQIRDLAKDEKGYQLVITRMGQTLNDELARRQGSGEDTASLLQLKTNLEGTNKFKRDTALSTLFSMYGTDIIAATNQEGNPYFPESLMKANENMKALTGGGSGGLTGGGSGVPLGLKDDAKAARGTGRLDFTRNFDNEAEAEAFFKSGKSVKAFTLGGGSTVYYAPTESGNDVKAAGVTGRLDSKGEGFVKPEAVSEIDDAFEGANIEEGFGPVIKGEGVPGNEGPFLPEILRTETRKPDDRPEGTADEIIEKGSNNIKALIDSLGETKYGRTPRDKAIKVREGVLSELEGMGITMPTNPTELGYFKNDLNSLLEDYNVDISGDLLYEIADIAQESAKTGRVAVPPEVEEAIIAIVANGTEEEIVQANEEAIKEFGAVAAGVLFDNAKAARGTGRSAVMDGLQTPYSVSADEEGYQPTSMGATELNTPAMREAIAKVPTEVREAFVSILERGDQEAIDEANKELAKEFGKDVASVLFDDAKSGRGTGKSAMMDGLQTPYTAPEEPTGSRPVGRGLFDDAKSGRGTGKSAMMDGLQTPKELNTAAIREVLDMVKSEISSKVFSVLSKGYLQTTMGSTEVNTPAIRKALSKVEKQLGPEVAAVLTRGYQPTTLGSTELNTPAMRKALSKVPGKVQDSVTEVLKKGTLSEIKEAKVEITKDFGSKVASILFDNLKSGRGTGKSAMMDGLQ